MNETRRRGGAAALFAVALCLAPTGRAAGTVLGLPGPQEVREKLAAQEQARVEGEARATTPEIPNAAGGPGVPGASDPTTIIAGAPGAASASRVPGTNGARNATARREGAAAGAASPADADTLDLDEPFDDLLLLPEPYYYESLGRRDIFVSLISETYAEENPGARPVTDELQVMGILWGEKDRFALLETGEGKSLILREGDSLGDGTVVRILPDRVVVHITEFGTSRTKTLPLVQGGGGNENSRSRGR